uniref:Thaumatin-like protein n=1 Tax=Pinus taeda TaxID=3352 RepID=A0A5B8LD22_PINTA|nr:thaumatin-like protein [Pinus taeda]
MASGITVFLTTFLVYSYIGGAFAATFSIINNCPQTIWPASLNPGGGAALQTGQIWTLNVPAGTAAGRIWGRTGCTFDQSGSGSCATGDCGGQLVCQASGAIPATLIEYTLNGNQNQDFYDMSLVDGFNLPASIAPSTSSCTTVTCSKDINADCPPELKVAAGGCQSACAAFPSNDLYCCRGQYINNCPPSNYSQFFKSECPQAYSYAKDDQTSTFTCPGGSDYNVVFCP